MSLAHEEGLVRYAPFKLGEGEQRGTLERVGFAYRDPGKVVSFEDEQRELAGQPWPAAGRRGLSALALGLMVTGMEPFLTVLAHPLLPWVMLTLALQTMFVTERFPAGHFFAVAVLITAYPCCPTSPRWWCAPGRRRLCLR